jgi:phage internal scaffolding protein
MSNIRKPYTQKSVKLDFTGEKSRTKQSHAKECDINNIMAKFQKTGVLQHTSKYQGQYGNITSIDFKEAMDIVVNGQNMFDELPSSIRNRFANDPAQFMDFMQNPENDPEITAEAVRLGLIPEEDEVLNTTENVVETTTEPVPPPAEPTA